MRVFLKKVRKPQHLPVRDVIIHSVMIFIIGLVLGFISKMLDETASNLLPSFLEVLDLRNFFSRIGFWLFSGVCISVFSKTPIIAALNNFLFFIGMVGSYYVYTVAIAGFFPKTYMMLWIALALLSPFLGAICWYAKGTHIVSICISALIFMMTTRQAFAFGFWYLDVRYILELFLWFLTIVVLYKTPKQIMWIVGLGVILFFITSQLNFLWGML